VDAERGDLLLAIHGDVDPGARGGEPIGTPNVLSPEHHEWPVLADVEAATRSEGEPPLRPIPFPQPLPRAGGEASFREIARRRRSAVDMDGATSISRDDLYRMLRTVVPALSPRVHALSAPRVHLLLFVHRVDGIDPGLALLVRDPEDEPALRASISLAEEWIRLPGAPEDLPLFGIASGDARAIARACTCHQDIAADGAFAVAMLAPLERALGERGPHAYRELHWEAGQVGQLLYLEAEAHGIGATGIGCFFDDAIHELLGLEDRALQALYCFTVGGPVADPRIRTLPAYAHRGAALDGGGDRARSPG
jgi:nitroreductase